jgi:hypothetical protein
MLTSSPISTPPELGDRLEAPAFVGREAEAVGADHLPRWTMQRAPNADPRDTARRWQSSTSSPIVAVLADHDVRMNARSRADPGTRAPIDTPGPIAPRRPRGSAVGST